MSAANLSSLFLNAAREAREAVQQESLADAVERFGDRAVDSALPGIIQNLHKANSILDHKIQTPPLSEFPKEAVEEFYQNIGAMANQIDQKAIRPDNTHLQRQLREAEARRRDRVGAESVALYKSHNANPDYATSGPARWTTQLPANSNFARDRVEEHSHTREDAVVLDVCELFGEALEPGEPVPDAVLRSDLFRYLAVPGDAIEPLQSLNAHDVAIELDNSDLGVIRELPLTEALALIRRRSHLPLQEVLVRPTGTIDACFALEATGSFFAVVSFSAPTLEGATAATVARWAERASAEIKRARDELAKEAEKQRPEFATTQRRDPEAIVKEIRRLRRLQQPFHADYRKDEGREPLCARTALLGVFDLEFSKLLSSLVVTFRYMYFSCCQCHHDYAQLAHLLGVSVPGVEDLGAAADAAEPDLEQRMIKRARTRIHTAEDLAHERGAALFGATEVHTSVPNQFETNEAV